MKKENQGLQVECRKITKVIVCMEKENQTLLVERRNEVLISTNSVFV